MRGRDVSNIYFYAGVSCVASIVDETDRPTGRPPTRPEKVAHYQAVGSGSPGTTAGGQHRETGAERLPLNRLWCEENSWNKAGPE